MQELKELIDRGIIYEDNFIKTYMSLIKDEEFLKYYGNQKEEAKKLLNKLIKESEGHKISLENIMKHL